MSDLRTDANGFFDNSAPLGDLLYRQAHACPTRISTPLPTIQPEKAKAIFPMEQPRFTASIRSITGPNACFLVNQNKTIAMAGGPRTKGLRPLFTTSSLAEASALQTLLACYLPDGKLAETLQLNGAGNFSMYVECLSELIDVKVSSLHPSSTASSRKWFLCLQSLFWFPANTMRDEAEPRTD